MEEKQNIDFMKTINKKPPLIFIEATLLSVFIVWLLSRNYIALFDALGFFIYVWGYCLLIIIVYSNAIWFLNGLIVSPSDNKKILFVVDVIAIFVVIIMLLIAPFKNRFHYVDRSWLQYQMAGPSWWRNAQVNNELL